MSSDDKAAGPRVKFIPKEIWAQQNFFPGNPVSVTSTTPHSTFSIPTAEFDFTMNNPTPAHPIQRVAELERQLNQLHDRLASANEDVEMLKGTIATRDATLKAEKEKSKQLEETYSNYASEIDRRNTEEDALKLRVQELEKLVKDYDAQRDNGQYLMNSQGNEYAKQIEELEEESAECQEELLKVEGERDEYKILALEREMKLSDLQKEMGKINRQFDELRNDNGVKNRIMESRKKQNEKLQAEVAELKLQIRKPPTTADTDTQTEQEELKFTTVLQQFNIEPEPLPQLDYAPVVQIHVSPMEAPTQEFMEDTPVLGFSQLVSSSVSPSASPITAVAEVDIEEEELLENATPEQTNEELESQPSLGFAPVLQLHVQPMEVPDAPTPVLSFSRHKHVSVRPSRPQPPAKLGYSEVVTFDSVPVWTVAPVLVQRSPENSGNGLWWLLLLLFTPFMISVVFQGMSERRLWGAANGWTRDYVNSHIGGSAEGRWVFGLLPVGFTDGGGDGVDWAWHALDTGLHTLVLGVEWLLGAHDAHMLM